MRRANKKSLLTRVTSVVLSAAMLLTSGGFDDLQAVRAADRKDSSYYDATIYNDSRCVDSTFYEVRLTSTVSSIGSSYQKESSDVIAKNAYATLLNTSDNGGTTSLNGFRTSSGSGVRNGNGGRKVTMYAAIHLERSDGVYATELSAKLANGKETVVCKDINGDGYFSPNEFPQHAVKDIGTSQDSVLGQVYVSDWSVEGGNISLDANGGNCAETSVDAEVGKTITSLPTAERKGYEFAGWYNKTAGMNNNGVIPEKMMGGDTRVKSGDTYWGKYKTLYAGWRPHVYSVVFGSNNGGGTMSSQNINYGEKTALSANQFTRSGYAFAGWNTEKDGSGQSYGDMAEVKDLSSADGGQVTLYAQWDANEYKITYDANGGTGNTDSTSLKYNAGGTVAVNGFARTGYEFSGWNTEPNGTGVSYQAGEKLTAWSKVEGLKLYAQWTPHTYSISYHVNTTDPVYNTPKDQSGLSCGQAYRLNSAQDMSRFGYTFDGWNTKADGSGTAYSDGEVVRDLTSTDKETVALYAQWRANTFEIMFDPNGGELVEGKTAADTKQQFTSGKVQALKTQDFFRRAGYTFIGWQRVGTEDIYGNEADYVGNLSDGATVTLKAVWKAKTYKVIQDMDGLTKTQDVSYDADGKLTGYTDDTFATALLLHKGETFRGWSTKENTSVAQYPDLATFRNLATGEKGDEEVVLYAVWSKNPSSIACYYVYEDEDGNYPKDRSGNGVITGNSGDAVDYTDGVRAGSDLYEFDYCAAYEKADERIAVAIDDDIKDKVTLSGNNAEEGTSAQHLVYYYKRKSYTLTFEKGKGVDGYGNMQIGTAGLSSVTNDDGSVSVQVPNGRTMQFKVVVKSGYNLANDAFGDASGGLANSIVEAPTGAGDNVFWKLKMPAHDIRLKAAAAPKKYTVSFVQNAPTGEIAYGSMPKMSSLSYDEKYSLYQCDYRVQGYDFTGWNTEADGSGTSYADKAKFSSMTTNDEITLYAQWKKSEYAIKFYVNDEGTAYKEILYAKKGGSSVYQNKGGTTGYDDVTIPTRQGYRFKGYYTGPEGTGTQVVTDRGLLIKSGGSMVLTENLTRDTAVYAKWAPVSYKISFADSYGTATGTMPTIDATVGQALSLPACTLNQKGYDFVGWSTDVYGENGQDFSDKDSVIDLASKEGFTVVLYAQWKPHTYTVRFHGNGIGVRTDGTDSYDMEMTYGEKYSLPLNTYKSRYSYLVFKGWNTDANLDYAVYGNGASVRNLSEYNNDVVDLYAVWGYDEDAKYAVRTWQQNVSSAREVADKIAANDNPYIDWGTIYNQENYTVKDTQMLDSKDSQFVLPDYDGFSASYQAEPTGQNGIVYYDFYYDRNQYSLKVDGSALSEVSGSGIYYYGEKVALTAQPKDGKHFGGWEVVSGDLKLKNSQKYNPNLTLEMPASNVVLKATESDIEIPIPTEEPGQTGGSGVDKNLGDTTIPDDGIEISATIDYRLIPEGVTLISAKSSNPAVAYVDSEGNLILGKAGTAVITLETSEGTYIYTIHMTGVNGVLRPGDVSEEYVHSVNYYIRNGSIITIPITERIPVISGGTIGKSTSTNPKVAYVGDDGYLVFGEDGEAIITTETSEGTIVYKVVIKDGKITIQSWKDENASGPSASPSASSAPGVTETPGTSTQPGTTDSPSASQTPSPSASQVPGTTDAPAASGVPVANVPAASTQPAAPNTVSQDTAATMMVDGITYQRTGNTAQVVKGAKSLKKASIRATILIEGKSYKVTGIASNAFKNCKKLSSVTFKATNVTISKNAFKGCTKLKTVTLTKVKTLKIAKGAFAGCKKITFKTAKSRKAKVKKLIKKAGVKKFTIK